MWHMVGAGKEEKEVTFSEQGLCWSEQSTRTTLHPRHITLHVCSQQTFGDQLL